MKLYSMAAVLLTVLSVTGCTGKGKDGYCDKHAQHHQAHLQRIASLTLVYTDDGKLNAELLVPYAAIEGLAADAGGDIAALLGKAENVFSVQAAAACRVLDASVMVESQAWRAHYTVDCGADNRLQKVDITLLDKLPGLDEVESTVQTPAVTKHFAISRQCDKPIYRL